MKIAARTIGSGVLLMAMAWPALAEQHDYPSKPIRMEIGRAHV